MPKNILNDNCKYPMQQIVCMQHDGLWVCVDAHNSDYIGMLFCDICSQFCIEIPYYVKYALLETDAYEFKFRQFGGRITLYYKSLI